MTALTDWLDARDSDTLAAAWSALGATRHELAEEGYAISMHGAAQCAAAILGWPIKRLAWLADALDEKKPIYSESRTVARCFLESGLDLMRETWEQWAIRELRDGERGVQHVRVEYRYDDGSREGFGGVYTVVRVFDRAAGTGAAILTGPSYGTRTVATIGDVDLGGLDLFERLQNFRLPAWKIYDRDAVRGLFAQVAAEVDAHFDVSPEWTERADGPPRDPQHTAHHFESGPRAIDLQEDRFGDNGWANVTVSGLPWGHKLLMYLSDDQRQGTYGHVSFSLPLAQGQAIVTRLASIPGLELG